MSCLLLRAAVLSFLLLVACDDQDIESPGVTADEIVQNPDEYYDDQVAVSGDVSRALGRYVLLLSDESLPVVMNMEASEQLYGQLSLQNLEGVILHVEGTVRPFDVAMLEQDLDIELSEYAQFEGQPMVLASSVNPEPEFPATEAGE